MRQLLFLAAVISLTQIACKKPAAFNRPAPALLDGQWRMIAVKDNISYAITTKPASITGDVDITFTPVTASAGTFMGNTPTNEIWRSGYTTGLQQTISIPAMGMTKTGETSWGILFVNNIRSSLEYSFDTGGLLTIITVNKTLTFQRQ